MRRRLRTATFESVFDDFLAAVSAARTPGSGVRACARLENAACSARLGYMADMLAAAYAASGSANREQWRCDNWSAVCAQIGAAHAVTSGVVSGLLMDAVTLRERLPKVAAVFAEGLIAYRLVHLMCTRTMLVKDAEALRALDAELADTLCTWGARSVDQTQSDIDALVLLHDPDAVRRSQSSNRSNYVEVATENATGTAYVTATVTATDGEAFDQRLDALARTVCPRDPRDLDQRRAAAVGAMGFGWDRLPCLCETDGCEAAATPSAGGVVIHVVGRPDIVDATNTQRSPHTGGPGDGQPKVHPPVPDLPREEKPAEVATRPNTAGDLTALRRTLTGKNPPLLPVPGTPTRWPDWSLPSQTAPGRRARRDPQPSSEARSSRRRSPRRLRCMRPSQLSSTLVRHRPNRDTGRHGDSTNLCAAVIRRADSQDVRGLPPSPTSTTRLPTPTDPPARRTWLASAENTTC